MALVTSQGVELVDGQRIEPPGESSGSAPACVVNAPTWVLENSPIAVDGQAELRAAWDRQGIGLRGAESLHFGRGQRADLRGAELRGPASRVSEPTWVSVRVVMLVVVSPVSLAGTSSLVRSTRVEHGGADAVELGGGATAAPGWC